MKRKTVFFTFIIGLAVVVGIFILMNKGRQPLDLTNALATEINIEPTQSDSAGVDTTSDFVVKTSTYIDPKIVAKNISIQPDIKFTVEEQKNKSKILLMPQEQLKADSIYSFTLNLPGSHPLKWAFQTKGEFKVNGTLPRDKSTGVPTNTGIEINFSYADFVNIDHYFEISPKVKGHFEIRKKTAVFVPEKLEPGTVYTVTVKKGLPISRSDLSLSEDLVFQFETQDPAQHNQNETHFAFLSNTMEFTSYASPVVPLGYYSSQGEDLPEMKVSVYQYGDAQAYIAGLQKREKIPYWAYCTRDKYLEDTTKLAQVTSFTTKLKQYGFESFLEFPQPLSPGYYLGQVSLGNLVRQVWFQITDLAVYTTVTKNNTLIWVNDLETGKPVSNGLIDILGSEENKVATDPKGLVQIASPQGAKNGIYFTVKYQNKEVAASVLPNWSGSDDNNSLAAPENYWKYFYLDRGLYQPSDTVQFWGLIKPRDEDRQDPRQVTIALMKSQEGPDNVLDSKQVKVSGNVFSGDFNLPNLIPGYYQLAVKVEGQVIAQQGFDVQTYTKPAYKINVVPDKKAVFAGDTVNFAIATSCFEDTPVPNIKLQYHLDQSGELTTNNQGRTVLAYTPQYQADTIGSVRNRYLYLNAALPESGEITAESSIFVLNNDINIQATGEITNKTGKVNIDLEKLTLDKVNQGKADPWEEKAFVSGTAGRRQVTVTVFRQEWDKIDDGEYYDFINKKVEKRYKYQERKVLVTKDQVMADRKGKAEYHFTADPKKSYLIQLAVEDSRDNLAKTELYLSGSSYPGYYQNSWYHLEDHNNGDQKYRDGEKIELTVENNESKVPDRTGGFLFYTARTGILNYRIQDTGIYKGTFSQHLIPNYWVKGVYFDGKTYHDMPEYLVAFDEQQKDLQVKVWTDKTEYRPQDKVHVTVEVRDKQGHPVAAKVNLNLVDEAFFMLRPQQTDILASLYEDYLASGVLITDNTHKDPTNHFEGAEQGGEGGSGRKDFKDTAFFEMVTTGKNGRATTSFQVPDNLTSWRLTYQAVTRDLQAGGGTAKVNVRLPLFVDMVTNDQYLAGDQPVLYIRSLGSDLKEGAPVNYSVRVAVGDEEYEKDLTGTAFESIPFSLPALKAGVYQITVTGKSGSMSDTLTRSFKVLNSFMTQEKIDHYLLNPQTKIAAATDTPVTLTFTDYYRSQYLGALCRLSQVDGSRIEQKLGSRIARQLGNEYFSDLGTFGQEQKEFDPSGYQTPRGGIGILPYASASLKVSAQIAALNPGGFDLSALKDYFYGVLNDSKETRERAMIALYGLASLGEPVLQDLGEEEFQKDLTVKEQLYLVLSLNKLGNEQPARKVLKELLKKHGEELGATMRINSGSSKDDVIEITALAALASSRLMLDEANRLYQYVVDNQPKDDLIYLEQILFLKENLPKLTKEEASFSYSTGGRQQTIKLVPGKTYSLMLTPEKLKKLTFGNIQGSIGVICQYQGSYHPPEKSSTDDVVIKREYKVSGQPTRHFKPQDLIEVSISWKIGGKAPDGIYRISDYLPAGLKLIEKPYNRDVVKDNLGWPVEVNGQKIVFLASDKGSLRYYARVVNGGIFTAQGMMIQHTKNGKVYSVTIPDKVEIK